MPAYIAVRPPDRPSESARTVRHMFGDKARLVRRDPIPRQYTKIINWGNSSSFTPYMTAKVYNPPFRIAVASNKLDTFLALKEAGVKIPEFSTTMEQVPPGQIWLARTILNGSGGAGIVVMRPGDRVATASLYTKYIRKLREFRVHVVKGETIFVQEKRRRLDSNLTGDQNLIRNYRNGWVYTLTDGLEENEGVPNCILDAGEAAVKALGLDFGAADVVLGRNDDESYVLEVNTAPGLRSPTLTTAYQVAFMRMLDE